MSIIYIIKSKTSGKSYIGQSVNTLSHRWKKHCGQINAVNRCSALYNAIKKYGVNDFDLRTLESGSFSKDELNSLEIKYIKKFKTLSPGGYNLQTGGGSFIVSEETKTKMSKIMNGREITWKDKISVGMKKRWTDPVYRKKMVKKHTGKREYKYKKHTKPLRLNIDINKISKLYKEGLTINQIAKKLNVCWTSIQRRIKE